MVKRVFDLITASIGLMILFPLLVFISCIIKIDSRGPVFFFQRRIGRYGKEFILVKFRSMQTGSDQSNTISIKGDHRITKFGVFLRKSKLDELPELWNVIKGEMSLVGPRPDVKGYADKLSGKESKILELRPGITGPASLKYANEEIILSTQEDPIQYNDNIIFPDKVKINLDYYYNQSLWLDIKIIFATLFRQIK